MCSRIRDVGIARVVNAHIRKLKYVLHEIERIIAAMIVSSSHAAPTLYLDSFYHSTISSM